MKKFLFALLVLCAAAQGQTNIIAQSVNRIRFVSQYLTPGTSLQQAITNACADATSSGTVQGTVVIEGFLSTRGAAWALTMSPFCLVEDHRGNGLATQTAFNGGRGLYQRFTSVNSGLQLPSVLLLEGDFYRGGVSNIATTKTQWQALRIENEGRTVGERKGAEINNRSYGIGDSIGIMGSCNDWGGYSTGGDEGCEGGRFSAIQGDGVNPSVPVGTVSAVNGDAITISWSANGANVGEGRPLIVTSRTTYSTGTLNGAAFNGGDQLCYITGLATAWLSQGFGAFGQGFMSIDQYSSSSPAAKFVIGPMAFPSDTTATTNYAVSELGPSCVGATTTGTYTVYRGAIVQSLSDPPSGSLIATTLNFATGRGVNFQVGDTVEQPLAYNNHPAGVQVVVGCFVCQTGAGLKINNVFTQPITDSIFINGNYVNGIRFGTGSWSGPLVQVSSAAGPFFSSSYSAAGSQTVLQLLDVGLTSRTMTFDRSNKWWTWGGGQYFSATDQRIGIGTNPQNNVLAYLFYNNAAWQGIVLAPNVAPNTGVPIFEIAVAGVTRFRQENLITQFANSTVLKGWSDQMTTQTWQINSATGTGNFSGTFGVGTMGTPNATLDVIGQNTGNSAIMATPKVGSGAYVITSNDSSGNAELGVTAAGGLEHPAARATDWILQNLDATHDVALKANGLEGIRVKATGIAQLANGAQVNTTTTKPTCTSALRGLLWETIGGAGVKDSFEVCAKDAADAYAWRTIY